MQCFRSPNHADCSEAFYKKEVENDIHTTPSKTAEERRKMIDLLKHFEEEAAADETSLLEEDSDDDLASQLESIELGVASYEDIWSVLTPTQRDKFLAALNDPSSDLAQQLLASEELEEQIEGPWWERPSETSTTRGRRYGSNPAMMNVPEAALKASAGAASSGPSLLYNIFATLVAYAYITRYLSTSSLSSLSPGEPERAEARRLFSTLVPFLTDKKSKTVLPSLSGLITDLWSRFEPDTMSPPFFAFLMQDAEKLIRPSPIVSISPSFDTTALDEHPSAKALFAFSDIAGLFERKKPSAPSAVAAKLAFYAARVMVTPVQILTALANEAAARAKIVEREAQLNKAPIETTKNGAQAGKPRIEELT
ncbi:hypothetical protein PHLGIDRAFT_127858 [Phlebiopsis gigantea 11061_1 CR5-6]|uniref:Uncharacterized protein n=1 Tax=Phlebiopsis gigantea (strain 11061_1 CR5-6) TaxID=745531 RepID=A0A0C3SAI5_PHLG1|nr:hypothetical protein PHLGIDRAFT_127858 [Phlebiopsis gigantea 11061_1 CR5-6]